MFLSRLLCFFQGTPEEGAWWGGGREKLKESIIFENARKYCIFTLKLMNMITIVIDLFLCCKKLVI